MIDAAQDVPKPQVDKSECSLMPSRVEPYQSWILRELKGANDSVGRHESQYRHHAQGKTFVSGMNRKRGPVRLNGIVHEDVQHGLIPIKIDVVGKPRPRHVGESLVVR